MQKFLETLDGLIEVIKNVEKRKVELGRRLREILIDEIEPIEISVKNFSVGAVDGGLVKKSFQGLDIIVVRAAGVVYTIKDEKVEKIECFPSENPTPRPTIYFDPFSQIEFEIKSNIERQKEEISLAINLIEKFKPDFLFLDGSIIPHYTLPPKDSLILESFVNLINLYSKLFSKVQKSKTILCGIIEDSRGKRFSEILVSKAKLPKVLQITLEKSRDTTILSYVLRSRELLKPFPYTDTPKSHPLISHLPEKFSSLIYSFYLRNSEIDIPLRIDFLADKGMDTYRKIASAILLLTPSEIYSIPSPLIEADKRARLSEKELSKIYSHILGELGPSYSLILKRRERRLA